jgi:hypothetical protein
MQQVQTAVRAVCLVNGFVQLGMSMRRVLQVRLIRTIH